MFSFLKRGRGFYKNLAILTIPIVLQNLITTSLGLIDTFMVGMLGEAPLAAVVLANIPVFVMQLIIFGLQSGSSVLISQYWGKRDTENISRVIGVGVYVAGAISCAFAAVMFFFPTPLMSLLTDNAELIPVAASYARIVGVSYMFTSITGVYVGAHRSMENPKIGVVIFGASMATNTFLNWVLIFGNLGAPALGVVGAATATLIARVVEFVLMGAYAMTNKRLRLNIPLLLRPGRVLLAKFLRYSGPVVINETLWGLGVSMYKVVMGHMAGSTEILAARALAGNIEDICTVAIFAVSAATSIVIGREIGAGRSKTVYEVGAALNFVAVGGGAVIGGLMLLLTQFVLAPFIYPIFKLTPLACGISTMMITFTAVLLPLRSFNTTNVVGVLRGGGDVRAAAMIDVLPLWVVALPLAALFGNVLKWGIFWVFIGISMENTVKFFMGLVRFRSRAWVHDVTVPSVSTEKREGA